MLNRINKNILFKTNADKLFGRFYCSFKTDEEIAKSLKDKMIPINKLIKKKFNISEDKIEQYGRYKSKLSLSYIDSIKEKKKW